MSFHKDLIEGDIHIPHQWSYANAAARLAAVGFVAGDVDKLALQEDDNSLWMLTAVTPTWLLIGGGSGAINFDRVVTVSKDGSGEFTTIQAAITAAAAGTPAPSNTTPWIVWVGPGQYVENVTGSPYVSIVGLGTKDEGAKLLGTYTFPASQCTLENLQIKATPGDGNFGVDCTANGEFKINNCEIAVMASSDQAVGIIEVGGGATDLEIADSILLNAAVGTAAGVKSHMGIKFSADNTFRMTNSRLSMSFQDVDDWLCVFKEDAVAMTAYIKDNIFITSGDGANAIHYFWHNAGTLVRHVQNNNVLFTTTSTMVHTMYVLFGGSALTVNSSHNRYHVDSPAGNSTFAVFAGAENMTSYFDDLEGLQVAPPAAPATFRYLISQDLNSAGSTMRTDGPLFIDNPPSAKAFDAGGLNVFLAAVPLVLVLDSESWDTHPVGTGFYDPATGVWTVPYNGDYSLLGALLFDMSAVLPSTGADIFVEILVNGAAAWSFNDEHIQPAGPGHDPNHSIPICTELALIVGDLVTIQVTVAVAGSVLGSALGEVTSLAVRKVR